jgi:phosphomannomutase
MKITINFKTKKNKIEFETDARYAPEVADILIAIAKKEDCQISLDGDNDRVVDLAQYLLENNVDVVVSQEILPLLAERIEEDEIDAFPPIGRRYPKEIKLDDLPF